MPENFTARTPRKWKSTTENYRTKKTKTIFIIVVGSGGVVVVTEEFDGIILLSQSEM